MGPLVDNQPCPRWKGMTFKRKGDAVAHLDYQVDWRELRACDYGAPPFGRDSEDSGEKDKLHRL
jgi:hypothetical protein